MKQKKSLSWEQFRYLNGVRRNSVQIMMTYEEYLQGLLDLGVVSPDGLVEKKIKKLCFDIASLNVTLSGQVKKEREKDISLYLEDI